ncbi:di-trans,poly-cis-decaprenylcistransferase [archaeon]|nr:di-trans,poly-cis-decaprenylcistransferase [archaeon]
MLKSIAFIPDGNRRFAAKHNISILKAYQLGLEKAEDVFDWCLKTPGLRVASIYALSAENLRRSGTQLKTLLGLYKENLRQLIGHEKIHRNKVRVNIFGKLSGTKQLAGVVEQVHKATAEYSRRFLNIALLYSGREEIVRAARQLANELPPEKFSEREFAKRLYVQSEPDLLVRTSGTQRISNFLPWQTAYSELYFSPKLWPEFEKKDYNKALEHYASVKRNFGH